jgi:FixJ family two-component response regulator
MMSFNIPQNSTEVIEEIARNGSLMHGSESMLIAPVIQEVLADAQTKYNHLPINFEERVTPAGKFSWVTIEVQPLKTMLAHVIKNSVEALEDNAGTITLHLDATAEQVRIIVEDNGKGLRPGLAARIMKGDVVTEGKDGSEGIGFIRVREVLNRNHGLLDIETKERVGTKMIFTFQRALPQFWIADTIYLRDNDIVVVLDEDQDVHDEWETRFEFILNKYPDLALVHFDKAEDAIEFINSHEEEAKNNILLVTDFELKSQEFNGLDVIHQTPLTRSIVVSSDYANRRLCGYATKASSTVLPRQLVSDIPIRMLSECGGVEETVVRGGIRDVQLVIVDDDASLLKTYAMAQSMDLKVDAHIDPEEFLAIIHQYALNTKIILDHEFINSNTTGVQIAEKLHFLGFTKLYILSGMNFFENDIPSYVTRILKTDDVHLAACMRPGAGPTTS